VQIEAVGDSQPIYYESMPKGEEGNRRAEIFVQS
jgi:flagellar motor protein MotB